MRERVRRFWIGLKRRPMFWVFIIVMLIFFPPALVAPAENDLATIVTGISIDKAEEGVELSIMTLLPQNGQTFSDVYRVASAKAENLGMATNKLENYLGKKVDLSHTSYVIFGDEICKSGIKKYVDILIKSNNIDSNAIIITTNGEGKKLLEQAKGVNSSSGEELEDVIYNNMENIYAVDTNIDAFYRDYLSTTSTSAINMIKLVGEEDEGLDVSSENSGVEGSGGSETSSGGSSSSGGESRKTKICNDGTTMVLKDAKFVEVLDRQKVAALSLVDPGKYEGKFTVHDYVTADGEEIDVSFEVRRKSVRKDSRFENGRGKVDYKINLVLDVLEVNSDTPSEVDLMPQKSFKDSQMLTKLHQKITHDFLFAYQELAEKDLDFIGVCNVLKRKNAKKYREFIENLENSEKIMQNIDITLQMDIEIK